MLFIYSRSIFQLRPDKGVNTNSLKSGILVLMLLSIKPRVLLALSVILSVWMFHDRLLEMSTPSGEELVGECGVWWVGWDGVLWRGVGWGGVG